MKHFINTPKTHVGYTYMHCWSFTMFNNFSHTWKKKKTWQLSNYTEQEKNIQIQKKKKGGVYALALSITIFNTTLLILIESIFGFTTLTVYCNNSVN